LIARVIDFWRVVEIVLMISSFCVLMCKFF
jgi:hypothetical protein